MMPQFSEPAISPMPPKRLGCFLPRADGTLGIVVQAHLLTDREWADFERYGGIVNDVCAFIVDFYALEADFEAFLAVEDEIAVEASALVNKAFLDTSASVRLQSRAQRAVSNFLAAGSAFRDRAVKRQSGRGSTAVPTFDALNDRIREIYDASSDYRIAYVLRNHVQHFENPISFCPIEGERGADGQMAMRMRMMLEPAMLVAKGKPNAKVRADIAAAEAQVPMRPLIEGAMASFRLIMLFLLEANRVRMAEMAQYAAMIFQAFEIPHEAKPVIFNGFEPEKGPPTVENCYIFGLDELVACCQLLDRDPTH